MKRILKKKLILRLIKLFILIIFLYLLFFFFNEIIENKIKMPFDYK